MGAGRGPPGPRGRPGDIVVIPPETRHWHGASASQAMAHFAVSEGVEGTRVTWKELVSDEEYSQGEEAESACPG